MKYKNKPKIIEAIWYDGDSFAALEWAGSVSNGNGTSLYIALREDSRKCGLFIKTLEGEMKVNIGDYIICGTHGEFYPCKSYIFEENYERVEV